MYYCVPVFCLDAECGIACNGRPCIRDDRARQSSIEVDQLGRSCVVMHVNVGHAKLVCTL